MNSPPGVPRDGRDEGADDDDHEGERVPRGPPPDRLILLTPGPTGPLVRPPPGPSGATGEFDPFPMPRLPLTDVLWAADLAARVWRRHRRCAAVGLLLDVAARRWRPVVPTQRCGRGGAALRWRAADLAGLPPTLRLVGSYQSHPSAAALDPFAAAAAVPPFDGVHVVAGPGYGSERRLAGRAFAFLRAEGEAALAAPSAVLSDDVAAALARHADRLRFD